MRYDSKYWFPSSVPLPAPVVNKSYLLMCEVRGGVRPTPRINWYLGGRPIAPGKHFFIIVCTAVYSSRIIIIIFCFLLLLLLLLLLKMKRLE